MPLVRLILALLLCPLAGCLLETELCGPDFVEVDDRCVLRRSPPPFRSIPGSDRGDASLGDGAPAPADAVVGRDGAPRPPAPWADFDVVVVVDRTDARDALRTPASPGADIDAVEVGTDADPRFGTEVVESFITQGGRNGSSDPRAARGRPELHADPSTYVSLGGDGGYVALLTDLGRPFTWGDHVTVYMNRFDGGDDRVEVFLCRGVPIEPSRCLSVARSAVGAAEVRAEL